MSKRPEYPAIADELIAEAQLYARSLERMDGRTREAKKLSRRHDLLVRAAMWIIGTDAARKDKS